MPAPPPSLPHLWPQYGITVVTFPTPWVLGILLRVVQPTNPLANWRSQTLRIGCMMLACVLIGLNWRIQWSTSQFDTVSGTDNLVHDASYSLYVWVGSYIQMGTLEIHWQHIYWLRGSNGVFKMSLALLSAEWSQFIGTNFLGVPGRSGWWYIYIARFCKDLACCYVT
jgi:hypothetical protein